MIRRHSLIFVSLLFACGTGQKDPGGTGVGNPGEALMRIAETGGVEFEEATVMVSTFTVVDCEGEEEIVELNDEFSLLNEETLPVPGGEICEMILSLDSAVEIRGSTGPATTFILALELPDSMLEVFSSGGGFIDETQLIWEFASPQWLGTLSDELTQGETTLIDAEHPAHEVLSEDFALASAIWIDADENGLLSETERVGTPLAAGEQWEPIEQEQEEEGRRCGGATGDQSWLLLGILPLWFRRRKATSG